MKRKPFTLATLRQSACADINGHVLSSPEIPDSSKKAKPSKYLNSKVVVGGVRFDSVKEANRWAELKLLESSGHIYDLKRQVKYALVEDASVKFKLSYIADFVYLLNGHIVIEDIKPFDRKKKEYYLTPTFKKKQRLMLKRYGIEIKIV